MPFIDLLATYLQNGWTVDEPTEDVSTLLHKACEEGTLEGVNLLLMARADVNAAEGGRGYTPLHVAAEKGHLDIVKRLLRAKADVTAVDSAESITPYTLAKRLGHTKVARALYKAEHPSLASSKTRSRHSVVPAAGGRRTLRQRQR